MQAVQNPGFHQLQFTSYEYTRGHMGMSSSAMQSILERFDTKMNRSPLDAGDLARCVFYVEKYLESKGRTELTQEETDQLSAASLEWKGIARHIHELRVAINSQQYEGDVTKRLQVFQNWGREHYDEEELMHVQERVEIDLYVQNLIDSNTKGGWYNLYNRSRHFANTLAKALDQCGFDIRYSYTSGCSSLNPECLGLRLLDGEYNQHLFRSFHFRKETSFPK